MYICVPEYERAPCVCKGLWMSETLELESQAVLSRDESVGN